MIDGLPLSLLIGTKYGKHLCRIHKKPFMPIHHMEAHALTARMHDKNIDFPFLVLLISGGHCLLAVAERMARRMKLKNLPDYSRLSGGQAVELAASKAADPLKFKFGIPMLQYKDCNFSFAGIKNQLLMHLMREEREKGNYVYYIIYNVPPDGVIPCVNDLCAGLQLVMTRHICHRIQRGMEYVSQKKIIPPDKQTLVVSGGAACNNFIAKGLKMVCDEVGYKMVRPPPKLCTDNGVMIAWNGAERWKEKVGIFADFDDIDVEKSSPLGESMADDVQNSNISCKWVKLTKLNYPQSEWVD
ncbi:hypothetical protein NQ318_019636 [Aromia moschata]|uniref:N(6)-L-threonylcarbamoyladenine synthase n=1 Tax=Aromia moschata TaxID=1265417 RepID=A0AAV8Z578_9CUCU|nr:hypothetical protein NQ318_019636 [Aromia moschata]